MGTLQDVFGYIEKYLHTWSNGTVLFRLLLAVLCGGVIGLTRSVKRRGVGFRTYSLVCIGACLVMMTGQFIYVTIGAIDDITRLAAQVVSGVGFLGVGTIMITGKNEVKGLTTAAGLWASAGIGIAIGIGFYFGAVVATILILIIFVYMTRVDEYAYEHSHVLDLYVELYSEDKISEFIRSVKEQQYKIVNFEIMKAKKNPNQDMLHITMNIEVPFSIKHALVIEKIERIPGVCSVEEL